MDADPRRRRLTDAAGVGVGLIGAWMALGPYRAALPTEPVAWWWADLVAGLLGAGLLLLRRRHPLGVALALGVVGVPFTTLWLSGIVAGFGLAVRRPWPWAAGSAALGLVAGLGTRLVRAQSPDSFAWSSLAWAVVITVAVLAWGAALRARHQLLDSLRERAERAEGEAALRAEAARAGERTRIAREMHDVLGHRLSLVSMHAAAIAHRRHGGRAVTPEEIDDALEVIRGGAQDALRDLRAILGVLRADADEAGDEVGRAPQPTLADLGRLVDGVRAAGAEVVLHDDLAGGVDAVPDECGRTLYRITQEALTNAARHAPGGAVEVRLRGRPGAVAELVVSNPVLAPGGGAGDGPTGGAGLVGIAERVELAGGRVLACGPDGGCFRVAVRVPWPAGVAS